MEISVQGTQLKSSGGGDSGGSDRISRDRQKATFILLGMTLADVKLGREEGRKMSSQRGVVALKVERDLEAFKGGVRAGDLVAEVNSTKIRSLQDIKTVLAHHEPHDPLFVFLLTSNGWRFTNLSFIKGFP